MPRLIFIAMNWSFYHYRIKSRRLITVFSSFLSSVTYTGYRHVFFRRHVLWMCNGHFDSRSPKSYDGGCIFWLWYYVFSTIYRAVVRRSHKLCSQLGKFYFEMFFFILLRNSNLNIFLGSFLRWSYIISKVLLVLYFSNVGVHIWCPVLMVYLRQ